METSGKSLENLHCGPRNVASRTSPIVNYLGIFIQANAMETGGSTQI